MLSLTFRQTKAEAMVRTAATIVFDALTKVGFPSVPLSRLADHPQYGFTASASEMPIGPKFVRITDLHDASIDWETVPFCKCEEPEKYLLYPNDLLFARTGATTGKTVLVTNPPQAVFASYLIRVRPQRDILPEYLYSFFQSDGYWLQISDSKEGSAQPNVNGQKLMGVTLPLVDAQMQASIAGFLAAVRARQEGSQEPLPNLTPLLDDKRRTIGRIETLAARIDEVRSLRQRSQEESDALLPCAWAKAYDEAVRIAGGTETLGNLCQTITDGTHITPRYVSEGVPFLSVKDITSGKISFDNTRFITPEEHAFLTKRCMPERDDILLTKVGTTGYAKMVDVDREFSIFVSLALLKLKKDRLLPKFTEYMLNSSRLKELSTSATRGVGNKNLVLKFIRNFPMPAPDLPEQHRIVARLDEFQTKIEALKKLQSETAAEIDALMPSILSKAFRGEL